MAIGLLLILLGVWVFTRLYFGGLAYAIRDLSQRANR